MMAEVNCGKPENGWDPAKLEGLLALQKECLEAFNACAAAARLKEGSEAAGGKALHSRAKAD